MINDRRRVRDWAVGLSLGVCGVLGFAHFGCAPDETIPAQLEFVKPHMDKVIETDRQVTPEDQAKEARAFGR